jgi:hypothetical protein
VAGPTVSGGRSSPARRRAASSVLCLHFSHPCVDPSEATARRCPCLKPTRGAGEETAGSSLRGSGDGIPASSGASEQVLVLFFLKILLYKLCYTSFALQIFLHKF